MQEAVNSVADDRTIIGEIRGDVTSGHVVVEPTSSTGVVTNTVERSMHAKEITEGTELHIQDMHLTVCRLLGKGGMGAVYLATDQAGQLCTIKIIHVEEGAMNTARIGREFTVVQEAFADENSLGCVPEPIAYSILNNGREELHCIVTEFIRGQSLDGIKKEHGPLPVASVAWLFRKAAHALAATHAKNIIHRDIKPANMMVGTESDREDFLLMDFGLARNIDDRTITQASTFLGTVQYAAPEMFNDGGKPSALCDVYSLGITMHELLTGKRPIEFEQIWEYFNFFQSGEEIQIVKSDDCPKVDDPVEQEHINSLFKLIIKMTHQDPKQRYTAAQVRDALDALMQIPNTEETRLILPAIDHRTESHATETVAQKLAQAASHIRWGQEPKELRGSVDEHTIICKVPTPASIKEQRANYRLRFASVLAGGTVIAAGVTAIIGVLAFNAARREQPSGDPISPVPVSTITPPAPAALQQEIVEAPKTSHLPHFIRAEDGTITDVAFGKNAEGKPFLMNRDRALIIGKEGNDNDPSCLLFMCDDDEQRAAWRLINNKVDAEPSPEEKKIRALLCLQTEDGGCLFYYPGYGIFHADATGAVTSFTQKQLLDKEHLGTKMYELLQEIHLGNVTQDIAQETLNAYGWTNVSPAMIAKGPAAQVALLLKNENSKEGANVQPVSATSKE